MNSSIFLLGEKVWVLCEYRLMHAYVIKVPKPDSKTVKVRFPEQWGLGEHERNVPREKVASCGELCALVRRYSDRQPRGTYRIERVMYADQHRPIEQWVRREYEYVREYITDPTVRKLK